MPDIALYDIPWVLGSGTKGMYDEANVSSL